MHRLLKFRAIYQGKISGNILLQGNDVRFNFGGSYDHLDQITGLHDKDGKDIWENDIICFTTKNDSKHYYKVYWSNSRGQWRMNGNRTDMALWDNAVRHEVVGTVYDEKQPAIQESFEPLK